jgi:hypothetical protein
MIRLDELDRSPIERALTTDAHRMNIRALSTAIHRQLKDRHNLRSCPLRNGDRVTEMICVRVSKQDRIRIHIVGCAGGFGVACQKRVNKDGLAAIGNKKAGMAEELDVWHDGVS